MRACSGCIVVSSHSQKCGIDNLSSTNMQKCSSSDGERCKVGACKLLYKFASECARPVLAARGAIDGYDRPLKVVGRGGKILHLWGHVERRVWGRVCAFGARPPRAHRAHESALRARSLRIKTALSYARHIPRSQEGRVRDKRRSRAAPQNLVPMTSPKEPLG